ncbi:MAG: ABC transporter permease [Candidatus Solibacter sp.]
MSALRVLLARLRGKGRTPAELKGEIAAHLAMLAADHERRGLAPSEARAAAKRDFGPVLRLEETYQEQRRLPFLDTLAQDVSYALRQLRRNPGFTLAAVLTLALGIGANSAIYQVLDAVVYRSLPVRDAKAIVEVSLLENGEGIHVSYPFYRDMAAQQKVFDGMIAVSDFPLRQAVLRGRGALRSVKGSLVTGNYFAVLGVAARQGRVFTAEDDRPGAPPVMVLSDAFWAREFGRSQAALGQVLEINGASGTVIGVAPQEFFGETVGSLPDLWLPIGFQPLFTPGDWLNAPSHSWLTMLGRLRPGVSLRQAELALAPIYGGIAELTVHKPGRDYLVQVHSASRGIAALGERFGKPLWVLMGLTGLVLLIACNNLANLMMGRAAARTQEIGVRLALGAGRARIARQLLTEGLLISLAGAALALLLAWQGARGLVAWASSSGDWRLSLSFDPRHVAFTAALAMGATCLFALAPAWASTRVDVHSALQAGQRAGGGRFRNRFGRVLVVAQLCFSLTLLSAAALLSQSLWNLRHQDFGYDTRNVMAADIPLEMTRAVMTRRTALRQPLYERMNAIPGVRSAALSAFGMLSSMVHSCNLSTAERPTQRDDFTRMVHVSAGYFETAGTRILAGRGISDADRAADPKIVVIGRTAARALFGNGNALGRLISTGRTFETKDALLVVGVAQDVRFSNPRDPYGFVLYVPMTQNPAPVTTVLVRAGLGAQGQGGPGLAGGIRAAFHEVDSTLLVGAIHPLGESVEAHLGNEKLLALLSLCFGVLALALTAVGVYSVIAYAAQRRTQEIGIRLALGAARRAVSWMMLRDVAALALAGTALGAVGAMAVTRGLRGMLFAFQASAYWWLVSAGAILLVIALAAGYIPARRAARLDPMSALRQQ